MKAGDIFQTNLNNGKYGAVKVIKTGGRFDFSSREFYLIAVLDYVSDRPPILEELMDAPIIVSKWAFPQGRLLAGIYCGKFKRSNPYLGNLPLNENEHSLEINIGDGADGGFPSCGQIDDSIGYEALPEWRYKNDTIAFIKDVERNRVQHQAMLESLKHTKSRKTDTL